MRALPQRRAQRRQRCADAHVARNPSVLHWHVQIFADQHPFAGQVQIRHVQHCHRYLRSHAARDQASAVSSMRFAKAHSLSYHPQTLTSVPPITFVIVAS